MWRRKGRSAEIGGNYCYPFLYSSSATEEENCAVDDDDGLWFIIGKHDYAGMVV